MKSRIALVRAPNPSPMTLTGTNSYLIDCGNGEAICIDPGPAVESHVAALTQRAHALGCRISLSCLTHTHPDHAPAALLLKERLGVPIAAHEATEFPHDWALGNGDWIAVGDTELKVIASPGHTFDHLAYYEPREDALFTGDTVLGEGYVVIAPPNGAMRAYERTLRVLAEAYPGAKVIYGGHGDPVHDPAAKLADYREHREKRQAELLAALQSGPQTIPELVQKIYRTTDRVLWPAAARQLLAYLIALEQEGRIVSEELPRALTGEEEAILNPSWRTIVGEEHARVVEAELGAMLRLDRLRAYRLSA